MQTLSHPLSIEELAFSLQNLDDLVSEYIVCAYVDAYIYITATLYYIARVSLLIWWERMKYQLEPKRKTDILMFYRVSSLLYLRVL